MQKQQDKGFGELSFVLLAEYFLQLTLKHYLLFLKKGNWLEKYPKYNNMLTANDAESRDYRLFRYSRNSRHYRGFRFTRANLTFFLHQRHRR